MSESPKAVFLSYASQDAEAAKRIADTLRAAGVEVWFDVEGGLETGDEWDAKIRRQIKECILFLPLISANTQSRLEGYFRIEWELASERAMGIAAGVPFIIPVVLDDTKEPDALVPDRFRKVQWTRLPGGVVTSEVGQRLVKLWSHRLGAVAHEAARASVGSATDPAAERRETGRLRRRVGWALAAVVALALLGGGYGAYRWYYRKQERAVLEALNMAPEPPIKRDGRVLVVPLENRTGDPAFDDLGRQLADHVRRRLPELDWVAHAQALRAAERLTQEASAEEMRALAQRTGADTLVAGHYRRAGDRLQFQGYVFDLARGLVFAELAPIEGDAASPTAAVEETAERLLGALVPLPRVRQGRQDAARFFNFSVPRRFDASQLVDRGKPDDLGRYRRAYEKDPKGGLGSLVALAMGRVFREEYAEADSALREVEARGLDDLSEYTREIARWLRSLLDGDSAGQAVVVDKLCRMMPSVPLWRSERGLGHYRANRPRALLAEFAGITPGSPGERVPTVWRSRVAAYFLLDDMKGMETAAQRLLAVDDGSETAYWALSYVAFRRGDYAAATRMLDGYDGIRGRGDLVFNLYVASLAVMRAEGRMNSPEFAALVRRADAWVASRPAAEAKQLETRFTRVEVSYLAGRYEEAMRLGQELLRERPDDVRVQGFVGTVAARVGDHQLAEETIARLRALDPRFRFGYPRFAEAKIAAVLGRPDEAMQLLREAFAQYTVMIKDFSWEGVRLSPDFESLRGDPRYQEFIKPRG